MLAIIIWMGLAALVYYYTSFPNKIIKANMYNYYSWFYHSNNALFSVYNETIAIVIYIYGFMSISDYYTWFNLGYNNSNSPRNYNIIISMMKARILRFNFIWKKKRIQTSFPKHGLLQLANIETGDLEEKGTSHL